MKELDELIEKYKQKVGELDNDVMTSLFDGHKKIASVYNARSNQLLHVITDLKELSEKFKERSDEARTLVLNERVERICPHCGSDDIYYSLKYDYIECASCRNEGK